MNKEEFLGKLQMVYVGDRNAFNEIVGEYDRLNNIINELEKYLNERINQWQDNENKWKKLGITDNNAKSTIKLVSKCILDKLKELKEEGK